MLFAILFTFWRFSEIVTLIPIMGMLAYFVHLHLDSNLMTPTPILLMFIVSTIALAWSVFTLFSYHRSSANARFVAVIDLAFAGALIAAVYFLRFIATADCGAIVPGSSVDLDLGALGNLRVVTGWDVSVSKACGMLKGCFGLGIMNVIFFFSTGVTAWIHGGHVEKTERRHREEERSRRGSRHGSRHSRHGSHHRSGSGQRSRRSSHSHSRAYV